jgi:tRNA(fMet)-specific endonuclease VapC
LTAEAPVLLDSDTLSEIMKGRDPRVLRHAEEYLREHETFRFSLITRYEILRGLHAKDAARQIAAFLVRCQRSDIYPVTEAIVDHAANLYGILHKRGALIPDADLLIAATALVHNLVLVTGNENHFRRVPGLRVVNWRAA